jgi:hypothetical protein
MIYKEVPMGGRFGKCGDAKRKVWIHKKGGFYAEEVEGLS